MKMVAITVITLVVLCVAALGSMAIADEEFPDVIWTNGDGEVHGTACNGAVAWTAETEAGAERAAALYTPEKCEALARGEGRLAE